MLVNPDHNVRRCTVDLWLNYDSLMAYLDEMVHFARLHQTAFRWTSPESYISNFVYRGVYYLLSQVKKRSDFWFGLKVNPLNIIHLTFVKWYHRKQDNAFVWLIFHAQWRHCIECKWKVHTGHIKTCNNQFS